MKPIFIMLIAAFTVSNTQAQTSNLITAANTKEERKSERITLRKLKGDDVSYISKQHFERRFKDATDVQWSHMDYFDVASFTLNNKNIKAYYDYDGKLVGTITPADVTDLPSSANKYINRHYAGYSIEKVIFYDDNEDNPTDMIMYDIQFEDSDSYFAELSNGTSEIVLHIFKNGDVYFFKKIS